MVHSSANGHRNRRPPHSELDESPPARYHALLLAVVAAFGLGFVIGYGQIISLAMTTVRQKFVDSSRDQKSTLELLGLLSKARTRLEESLVSDYGDYYGLIFDRVALDSLFVINSFSKERLLRRIMTKIILAQQHAVPTDTKKSPSSSPVTTFTWATGGDSAAAGHGNLFGQSYSAVMENTVKDAFASVGVNFIARNYGMGGYVSAPELAMCMESVYGPDLDILAWDFGMMEGETDHRVSLWGSRASVHPTKPILFVMDVGTTERWRQFLQLEQQGMGTVLMDQGSGIAGIRNRVPDAQTGEGSSERIPPPLRNFICDGKTEGAYKCDDPVRNNVCQVEGKSVCVENKFNTNKMCFDAKYQTSWHPGWKEHYLKGRLLGFFLVEMLNEAVLELDSMMNTEDATGLRAGWDQLLTVLMTKEDEDRALVRSSPALIDKWVPNRDTLLDVNPSILYKKHAVCRTALLPSQERYDGILTGSKIKGNMDGDYERGTSKHFLGDSEDGVLPLVFDPNDRQKCDKLEIDHKDFFFVRPRDGWLSTVVPNKAELEAYGKGLHSEGIILVCLKVCPLKRCPDESVGFGAVKRKTNKVQIKVDGKPVIGIKKFESCHFLVGEDGLRWGQGKVGPGQYKLAFRINDSIDKWMKISSIVDI